MNIPRHSPTRTDAGTFPGGHGAAGAFTTTHGKGDGSLTAARAVLAQVSECDDRRIARACRIVLESDRSEPQERIDALSLMDRIPMVVLTQLEAEGMRAPLLLNEEINASTDLNRAPPNKETLPLCSDRARGTHNE